MDQSQAIRAGAELSSACSIGVSTRRSISHHEMSAHFNLRCLLLPALIGLLIDLSHAYITTLLPGSFRAPHSWDVWSVNRQAGSPV